MRLQDQLDQRRAHFESGAPADVLKIMHTATDELSQSDILTKVLKIGDTAPGFSLSGPDNQTVTSKELLAKGPLVLHFFRGGW